MTVDEKKLNAIIKRVLLRIYEETAVAAALPKAYLILPPDWENTHQSQCLEALRLLRADYSVAAISPDVDGCAGLLFCDGATDVIKQDASLSPANHSISVFPVSSRDLVVKTALCLEDDFETKWTAKCIALGASVYMRGEFPLFTGREPVAYRKKIEAYYRDAEQFGVRFDWPPSQRADTRRDMMPGKTAKKRIITAGDLEELQTNGELRLNPGDIVTAFAEERALELGIRIVNS